MKTTLAFWNNAKKQHGKGAPTLGMTPVLKEWEKSAKALDKTKSLENLNQARTDLNKVETTRKKAQTKLDENYEKWKDLYGDLSTMESQIKKDHLELDGIENEIGLSKKIEKAGSELEAAYEITWDGFEKVREGLGKSQDRGDYQMAVDILGKLKKQADKIISSGSGENLALIGKYQKQLKVLAGLENTIKQNLKKYEDDLGVMVDEREKLLKEFGVVNGILTQTTSQLEAIKGKAQTAKSEGKDAELLKQKKAAAMLSKGGLDKYQELADGAYKPGTKIRGALDVKAAKVSTKDSDEIIRPWSDKSFTAFKELTELKRGIETLAKDILMI